MGRPERKDVDYFPFYIKDGKTLFILESKYQCKGTGFFTNVMRFLCRTPDHHICIKEDTDRLYFFSSVKCDEESGMDMLNIMSKTGKIDAGNWVTSRVIVSQDLLDSISDAYRKRNNTIITIDEITQKYVSADGKGETAAGNEVNGVSYPQSKVKESKGKKTIFVLPEYIDPEIWDAFLEMRKVSNAKPTDRAIGMIIKQLEAFKKELNQDPNMILRESIMNNWKGVFPLKQQSYNNLNDEIEAAGARFLERQRLKEAQNAV